ncbi:Aminodeoxychorismate lyase, partial [Dysosmobacter welbionis]
HAPDGDRCLWTGCAAKRHGAESGYQLGPSRAGRPGRDRYALRHSRRGGALSRRLYNQRHTGRPLGHYPLSDAGGGAERKSGATGGFFIFHPGASAASGNSSAVFSRNADPIR